MERKTTELEKLHAWYAGRIKNGLKDENIREKSRAKIAETVFLALIAGEKKR